METNVHQRRRQSRHRSYSPPASPSFHSMSYSSQNGSDYSGASTTPQHPMPSMQAAFEESILDLEVDAANTSIRTRNSDGTASSSSRGSREWRKQHRRHSEHHRLLKLVSQIAFGIHLLHARLAKSDPEVVRILQAHVNDMDFFVSSTTTDFELAKQDIGQRLKHLRVPLDSGRASEVFDEMLENREFRLDIIKGNENVEYVISRTAAAMKSALIDVREGLSAVDELAKYLLSLKKGWKNTNLIKVYTAMTFNVEQWFRGLVALQAKGMGLKGDLEQLKLVVREIEKRTGVASRKNRESIVVTNKKSCPTLKTINKPLPTTPSADSIITAIDIRQSRAGTVKKTLSKRSHSQTTERRKTPTFVVTAVNEAPQEAPPDFPPEAPLGRSISERLLNRPRTRSKDTPEHQQEYEKQKRLSRLRPRPTPEMWPEPLSVRSGEVVNNEDEGFSFNPDKLEVKRKSSKEKVLRRPESCLVM